MTAVDWTAQLHDQLDFYWQHSLRPRLEGLTDEEYLWEPVADCWSVRRRADARTSHATSPHAAPATPEIGLPGSWRAPK